MILTISNNVIDSGFLRNENPPLGPFVELMILFFASCCRILARKGVGSSRSAEICFIPILFFSG
jgi:hypothetical protein